MVSAKAGKRAQGHKKRLRRASGDGKGMGSISWGRTGVALTAPSEIRFLGEECGAEPLRACAYESRIDISVCQCQQGRAWNGSVCGGAGVRDGATHLALVQAFGVRGQHSTRWWARPS